MIKKRFNWREGKKGFSIKKKKLICPPFSLKIEYEDHYINITYTIKIKLERLFSSKIFKINCIETYVIVIFINN